MKPLLVLALLMPLVVGAQVRKCTIEGRIVYSDAQCGQSGTTVDTSSNTIDHSGLRQQAAKNRATEAAMAASQRRVEAKRRKTDERATGDAALKRSSERLHKSQNDLADAYKRALRPPGY